MKLSTKLSNVGALRGRTRPPPSTVPRRHPQPGSELQHLRRQPQLGDFISVTIGGHGCANAVWTDGASQSPKAILCSKQTGGPSTGKASACRSSSRNVRLRLAAMLAEPRTFRLTSGRIDRYAVPVITAVALLLGAATIIEVLRERSSSPFVYLLLPVVVLVFVWLFLRASGPPVICAKQPPVELSFPG